jgi:endonuclease/exonuclease/phosphatase family metal-dependent hydrolase
MRSPIAILIALVLFAAPAAAPAQVVGDRVMLESTNLAGVPVHPAAGDAAFVRWASGTVGTVRAIDPATGWFQVEAGGAMGWIIKRYLIVVPAEEPDPVESEEMEQPAYIVGTWNLEHFRDGAGRGFPENQYGGPSYPARSPADYALIAVAIRDQLLASVLVLTEVAGQGLGQSAELDRLVAELGTEWDYEIGASGGGQRIAILFDTRAARVERCVEIAVAELELQGKDIFDRDPFVCRFTFLRNGQPRNDLLVVGVHLASGQQLNTNHNRAMLVLRQRLLTLMTNGTFPAGERDVLIAGDFNASRYDVAAENFWTGYDAANLGFVTLAPENGDEYPGTRLAGVPLYPRSQIDYVLASAAPGGLADELVQPMAHVHEELLPAVFDEFRRHYSDHLPVTVRIRVVPDGDPE